jgi:hypothetical protein
MKIYFADATMKYLRGFILVMLLDQSETRRGYGLSNSMKDLDSASAKYQPHLSSHFGEPILFVTCVVRIETRSPFVDS